MKKTSSLSRTRLSTCLAAAFLVAWPSACAPDENAAEPEAPDQVTPPARGPTPGAERLPSADRWRKHLTDEILPYWTMPSALGEPVGDFPTFRCNDGARYHAATNACPELRDAPEWIRSALGREYTRMKSRQTFGYGAAFHMTGDPRLLELHLSGVRWLLEHAMIDGGRGGAISYFEDGHPDPDPRLRTSQDQAYAALGLSMNYYLTRDPAVLAVLADVEAYIFSTYDDPTLGMLRGSLDSDALELVTQLDQLNAYLLLVQPILPDRLRAKWDADIRRVVDVIETRFHAPSLHLFHGAITRAEDRMLGARHTDFGHTIKSYWMIYLAGRLLDEPRWRDLAVEGSVATLRGAYITESTPFGDAGEFTFDRDAYRGAWAQAWTGQEGLEPKSVWPGTEWWSYAELDQVASTWLIREPGHASLEGLDLMGQLETTTARWFERMVDPVFGGIFHRRVNRDRIELPKCHLWKSAFHETEHALIGAIAAAQLRAEPLDLYFAFAPGAEDRRVFPYFFEGDAELEEVDPARGLAATGSRPVTRARFTNVR